MKIEAYKRTRIKKELLKAKEMLEEIKDNEKSIQEWTGPDKSGNEQVRTKQKRLTLNSCVELKREILDLHDKKMNDYK